MTPKTLSALEDMAGRGGMRRVVLAAAQDAHALQAVLHAHSMGLCSYTLVGPPDEIQQTAARLGLDVDTAQVVPAAGEAQAAAVAVGLVRSGQGDFLMKGALQTARLLSAVVHKETGIRAGEVMSHVALLQLPGWPKLLAVTDGGMVIQPTLAQKKAIAENAAALLRCLGCERPKIGVLAAVETVNPKMPATTDAAALKAMNESGELPGCLVEGPISFDLAVSAESAGIKGYQSPVTGEVDIMLVPDMTAGNILSKALVYMAGAKMAGVVVGARAPIVLVSRGASAEEKYYSIALAAAGCAPPQGR